MSNVTMADLRDGVRIRHLAWGDVGTVRVRDGVVVAEWDFSFGPHSYPGPLRAEDIEIVGEEP